MEAIILAGGKGTRIAHLLDDIPKPMYQTNQGPFLQILLDQLIDQGVTSVILAVGYKYDVIKNYFGNSYRGVPLIYSIETNPLGTGGALKHAVKHISSQNVLVLNGDTYSDLVYKDLIDAHQARDISISIALRISGDSGRYGSVTLDNIGFVTNFNEKKAQKTKQLNYLNCGVYVFTTKVFEKYCTADVSFSLEEDFLPQVVSDFQVYGLNCVDEFIDIGTPASLAETNDFLVRVLRR